MPRSYAPGLEPIPGYRLRKFLGRGGFGEVWEAVAPGGTPCAVKIINLKDRQGLKEFRAIRLIKGIRHPHLTPVYAFWLKDDQSHIMDESSGDDSSVNLRGQDVELILAMGLGSMNLLDRLEECQREGTAGIPVEELLEYIEDAAKGIDYLNQPGDKERKSGRPPIQHCDIKPQNILIVGNSAQVCDFGLARPVNDARKTSQAAISFAYVSPELIQEQTSPAVDQYSLAISYYELRTGSLPFNGKSTYDVMFAHLQGKLTFARVTEGEQAVLKRATANNPADRFPSCLEMVRALRRAVEGKASSGGGKQSSQSFLLIEKLEPGDVLVHGYRLVRKIGRGGYGEVWESTAPGGKKVALKVIHNLDHGGARHEFRALETIKGLDHNHLMEVHAYWLLDPDGEEIPDDVRDGPGARPARTLVIATKLATKNLLERLNECQLLPAAMPGIPFDELLQYMRQAADALDYLNTPQHPLGDRLVSIQHRDVKPENILLATNIVKLSDFGLAKVLEGSSAFLHTDSAGLTLHYAAPEVFSGEVTERSDQYSLALTYLHLRTGVLPFARNTKAEIMRLHTEGRLDLSLLPEPERGVLARATALDPADRFPSCLDMVDALEAAGAPAQEAPPITPAAPSPSHRTQQPPQPPGKRKTQPVIMEEEFFAELSDGMDQDKPATAPMPVPLAELPPQQKEPPLSATDSSWIELDAGPSSNIFDTVPVVRKVTKASPPSRQGGKDTEKPSRALADTDPAHQALPAQIMQPAPAASSATGDAEREEQTVVKIWHGGAPVTIPPAKRSNKGVAVLTLGALLFVVGAGATTLYLWHGPHGVGTPATTRTPDTAKVTPVDGDKEDPSKIRPTVGTDSRSSIVAAGQGNGIGNAAPAPSKNHAREVFEHLQGAADKADWQGVQNDVKELEGLQKEEANFSGKERARIAELAAQANAYTAETEAIENAKRVERPADREASARTLSVLLRDARTRKRALDLFRAYAELALHREKKYRLSAVETLRMALAQMPDAERDKATSEFQNFLARLVQEVKDRIPGLHEPKDYDELEPYCGALARSGCSDAAVWFCWAECLVEKNNTGLKQAREAAWNQKVQADGGAYGHYVRGRILDLEGSVPEAVKEHALAFASDAAEWQNAARHARAADFYYRAGTAAREGVKPDWSNAFGLYKEAVRLVREPDKHYRLALAEAAFKKVPPSNDIAKDETGKLLGDYSTETLESLGNQLYLALSIHAKAQELSGEEPGILKDYETIMGLGRQNRLPDVKPDQLYVDVILPAIEASQSWLKGKPADGERQKTLSRLYSEKGHLLWENQFDYFPAVPAQERGREAMAAYARAVENYPGRDETRAELLMWKGYLLTQVQTGDLAALRQLAKDAADATRTFHASEFLVGLASYREAEANLTNSEAALVAEDRSIAALDRAIAAGERSNPQAELLDVYYSYHSGANVLKANSLHNLHGAKKRSEFEKCLEDARKDADHVIKKLRPRHAWLSYVQRGNAEEDLAWLCKQESKYAEALADFRTAIEKSNTGLPQPCTSRGRAFYKRYLYGSKHSVEDLKDAKVELERASLVAKAARDDWQLTEASLWLAKTCLALREYPEAVKSIDLAIDKASPGALGFATNVVQEEMIKASELVSIDKEKFLVLSKSVRDHCAKVRKKNPSAPYTFAQTFHLAAFCWILEGNLERDDNRDQAKANYQNALQLFEEPLADPSIKGLKRSELLLALDDILLRTQDLLREDLAKDTPTCLKNAEEAIELAKESGQKGVQARAQFRLAQCQNVICVGKDGDPKRLFAAIEAVEKALDLDPESWESWQWRLLAGSACNVLLDKGLTPEDMKDIKKKGQQFLTAVVGDERVSGQLRQVAITTLNQISGK